MGDGSDLASPTSRFAVGILPPDSVAARGAAYCDSRPYALQIDFLGSYNGGGGVVVDGYERVVATEICGFDPSWLVSVRVELRGQSGTLLPVAAGVVDADEGTVDAPLDRVVMTQADLRALGAFVVGRPSVPNAEPTVGRRDFRVLFTPVVPGPEGGHVPTAPSLGWSTWTEPYRMEGLEAWGRQGEPAHLSVVWPVGVVTGATSRFHPLSALTATATLDPGPAAVGGVCAAAWGEDEACAGGPTATVSAASLYYGVPQRFLDLPDTPSPLDDPPPTYLSFPLDGPKDATLAASPAVVGDLVLAVGRDEATAAVRLPVRIGGYDYRLTFADGTVEAEVAYGDSVAVVIRPVYADGTPLALPGGFLVDRVWAGGGYVDEGPGPPTVAGRPESAAKLTGDGHTDPSQVLGRLIPPDEIPPRCGSTPESRPVRFSLAGASVSPYSPGPWVGMNPECMSVAYDVPYARAEGGELWLVADGVVPVGEQPLVAGIEAWTNFGTAIWSRQHEAYSNPLRLTVLPAGPTLRLLQQNDAALASNYVRVSKVRPDWMLPQFDLDFDDPGGTEPYPDEGLTTDPLGYYDPDTYRPEVSGLATDGPVTFRLEVRRGPNRAPIWTAGDEAGAEQDYAIYPGILEREEGAETWAARGRRSVRLVSNARPPEWSEPPLVESQCGSGTESFARPCDDDEVADLQTILVELGDRVEWTAIQNGQEVASRAYTVGDFSVLGASPDAVQEADVRWILAGPLETPADLEEETRRMNRYWAQAGIRFVPTAEATAGVVDNVIEFDHPDPLDRTHVATRAGTARVSVRRPGQSPISVAVPYGLYADIDAVAAEVARQLQTLGVAAQFARHQETFALAAEPGAEVIEDRTSLILLHGVAGDAIWAPASAGLDVRRRVVDPQSLTESGRSEDEEERSAEGRARAIRVEAHVLTLRYGDANPATIDYVVVPDAMTALGSLRGGGGAAYVQSQYQVTMPTRVNTILLTASAADGRDRHWMTLGEDPLQPGEGMAFFAAHDAGHLLLNFEIDGHDVDPRGHLASPTSLMGDRSLSTHESSVTGPKRITGVEQRDARRDAALMLNPAGLPPPTPRPPDDGDNPAFVQTAPVEAGRQPDAQR